MYIFISVWLFALVKHFNKGITIIIFLERTSYSHTGCALNLLNITSKSCTTVIFVTVDSHITFMHKFVSMFMINLHTKFHILNWNGWTVITIKIKAKENVCMAAMLFHILQKNYLKKLHIFQLSIIIYNFRTLY